MAGGGRVMGLLLLAVVVVVDAEVSCVVRLRRIASRSGTNAKIDARATVATPVNFA